MPVGRCNCDRVAARHDALFYPWTSRRPPPLQHRQTGFDHRPMNGARARLYAAVFGWSIVALGVWLWMTVYAFEAYQPADRFRHASWPKNSRVSLADSRCTLLFFIHPRCPCTRASVTELEKLLAGHTLEKRQRPEVIVVAAVPPEASTEWRDSNTIKRAMHLPNAALFW